MSPPGATELRHPLPQPPSCSSSTDVFLFVLNPLPALVLLCCVTLGLPPGNFKGDSKGRYHRDQQLQLPLGEHGKVL